MSYAETFRESVEQHARELDYLERTVNEQREIIEQLTGTGKPKGYVYMHPYDVKFLVDKMDSISVISDWRRFSNRDDGALTLNGRVIKQSAHIPPINQTIQ